MLRTGESFGAEHLIAILRGERTEKVTRRGHDRLPTFGVGADRSKAEWQAIFRQLMGLDLVRPDPERHGALRLTEAARPVLRGEASARARAPTAVAARGGAARCARAARWSREEDEGLLRGAEGEAAARWPAERGVPAYVIFPDRTLIEMATARPGTLDAMRGISGVGAVKLERFGPEFLEVLTGAAPAPCIRPRLRLPASPSGGVFDRLQAAQVALARGADGRDKYLNCTQSTLAPIAERAPRSLDARPAPSMGMGPLKTERFGEAFLAILAACD